MPLPARIASLWRNLFRRSAVEAGLHDEVHTYVALLTGEKIRSGMGPADARLAALREVGSIESVKEEARHARIGSGLDTLAQDLRYAIRTLARRPGFTAAVVLSLAIGVGGTTAIFSVVNAVLLRSLPYPDADRLHEVRIFWGDFSASLSPADRLALRETTMPIGEVGAYFYPNDGFTLTTPVGPQVVQGAVVTPELPRLLGVAPARGRLFSEDAAEGPVEVLVSDGFWRSRLAGAPDVVGRSLTLDTDPVTIVGVMPPGFGVGQQHDAEVWVRFEPRNPTRRGAFYLNTVLRLAPGVAPEAAAPRLTDAVVPVLKERYGVTDSWRYQTIPLKDALVGNIRPSLRLLSVAVALVLLIGVLNVSNLLLARGVTRRQELGVRAALGAGRGRLVRQLLVESAALGVLGSTIGLALAGAALAMGADKLRDVVPRMQEVRLDAAVVLFALAVGIGAGLLAGVVPAWRLPWAALAQELREGGRGAGTGRRQGRARRTLVVAEVALTLTVLTGAALLLKSLRRLESADPGFAASGALTFRLNLPESTYPDTLPARMAAFLANLAPRLAALPGVRAVGFSGALPPADLQMTNNYTVEGDEAGGRGQGDVAEWMPADTGYFGAMGIPLLRGRVFEWRDRDSAPAVVVVNQTFARRHFGATDPVGKRLKGGTWNPDAPWLTIVGVVGDVPYGSGVWNGADATVYTAFAQSLWWTSPFVVLRAGRDAERLIPAARQAVLAVDPSVPLRDVATLDRRLRDSAAAPRIRGFLFAALGAMALALALTGIYGLLAHEVSQRERETAVRRALGASSREVMRMVVGSGMRLAYLGAGLGVLGAILVMRALASFLYGVDPVDGPVIVAAVGVLLTAALAACVIPARRAARVEPMEVLRGD